MKNQLETLTELLREFPGIGPRQARRIALWLVRRNQAWIERLSTTIIEARKNVEVCAHCTRLFPQTVVGATLCSVCADTTRDGTLLMLVEKDVDLENIERTGVYRGRYFVLGGTTKLPSKEPEQHIRIRALMARLSSPDTHVREIIFALSATTEGEDTAEYVREKIRPLVHKRGIILSELARGLSTGTELEYVDVRTMQNALSGRTKKER